VRIIINPSRIGLGRKERKEKILDKENNVYNGAMKKPLRINSSILKSGFQIRGVKKER